MKIKLTNHNDYENIRRFLIFPKKIGREIRWLEWATFTRRRWVGRSGTQRTDDEKWVD